MAYDSKNELVQGRRLKTLRLVLPVLITANATAANKTITYDEPALLFLKTEGVDHITAARGAMTQAELDAITFATANDGNGIFSCAIRVGEAVEKVCSVKCVRRDGAELVVGTPPTGASAFLTSGGQVVVANFDSGVNLSTTNGSYCIEVEYVV